MNDNGVIDSHRHGEPDIFFNRQRSRLVGRVGSERKAFQIGREEMYVAIDNGSPWTSSGQNRNRRYQASDSFTAREVRLEHGRCHYM
jgi:hypothetical protein